MTLDLHKMLRWKKYKMLSQMEGLMVMNPMVQSVKVTLKQIQDTIQKRYYITKIVVILKSAPTMF